MREKFLVRFSRRIFFRIFWKNLRMFYFLFLFLFLFFIFHFLFFIFQFIIFHSSFLFSYFGFCFLFWIFVFLFCIFISDFHFPFFIFRFSFLIFLFPISYFLILFFISYPFISISYFRYCSACRSAWSSAVRNILRTALLQAERHAEQYRVEVGYEGWAMRGHPSMVVLLARLLLALVARR